MGNGFDWFSLKDRLPIASTNGFWHETYLCNGDVQRDCGGEQSEVGACWSDGVDRVRWGGN